MSFCYWLGLGECKLYNIYNTCHRPGNSNRKNSQKQPPFSPLGMFLSAESDKNKNKHETNDPEKYLCNFPWSQCCWHYLCLQFFMSCGLQLITIVQLLFLSELSSCEVKSVLPQHCTFQKGHPLQEKLLMSVKIKIRSSFVPAGIGVSGAPTIASY